MKHYPFCRILIFLSLAFAFAVSAAAQDYLPELVRRIKPSAVSIETFDARGNNVSRGSGFFIAPDRIVTNRHVIENSNRVIVHLTDGKRFVVKGVIAVDGEGDLALLQVEVPAGVAVPLPVVRSVPQEGESVVVIGNPFGLEGSVSNGIVSAVRDISGYGRIIQITAPISPGSSGSPVVNMRGHVIGVATLQASEGQSLNFAIPSERILQLRVGELQSFSALSSASQQNKRAAAERLYSQGVVYLSQDDFDRALGFFVKAAETDPAYAEAWYQAGFCHGVLGRHNEALIASQRAAALRPNWPEAHVNIGASSFAIGKYEDAAAAYRRAILIEDSADTQYALGLTLNKLKRPGEEILAYNRAVALKPDHANAIEKLGNAYFSQKRYADAAALFEQLRDYKPDAKTYNLLGESYFESGRIEESQSAFNSALGFDPDFHQARFNLGRAYVKLGNPDMARVQYEILRNADAGWADRLLVLIDQ